MVDNTPNVSDILLEEDKPVDFRYYLHLFRKNISIVITLFVIAVTVSSIFVSKTPDVYRATTTMVIERPKTAIEQQSFQNVVHYEGQASEIDETFFNTQKEIMLGNTVLTRVSKELKLKVYFETNNDEAAVNRLRTMLSIHRVKESRLVKVSAKAPEPKLAARVANSVAENFIKKSFEDSLHYNQEVLTWLQQDNKDSEGYITITDPLGKIRKVKYEELIENLPVMQTDPVVRSLKEKLNTQESDLEGLLQEYKEKHPRVIKLRAEIRFSKDGIAAEKRRILQNLKAKAEGQLKVKPGRIIEPAKVPSSPVAQDNQQYILFAAIGSILLGCAIIFALDFFDDTIHTMEDFERKGILIPFLGPLPILEGVDDTHTKVPIIFDLENSDDRTAVEEAYRYIRVAINFSAPPDSLKILAISSCIPGDGKSFVSTNIAASLAKDGNKILLVDADLRRPVIHNTFAMENDTGMSNFLTSNVELDSVVRETPIENLSVITSGPISPNPSEILGSERMKVFLDEANKTYDRVILDCPPLTGIGDGFVVGSQIGHIILVVAASKTPSELIKHTQQQLDKMQIKVLGTVLNRMDVGKEKYGGYTKHYYNTYNKYYRKK